MDSLYHSIDESMAKFKGRSSLKQFMPLNPVERGIKIWMRSDSKIGYVYDFDIYQGKSNDTFLLTLCERVVQRLLRTVTCRPEDVTVATDRFFMSVHLINTVNFPMVGTYIIVRIRQNFRNKNYKEVTYASKLIIVELPPVIGQIVRKLTCHRTVMGQKLLKYLAK